MTRIQLHRGFIEVDRAELDNEMHPDADRFLTPNLSVEEHNYRAKWLLRFILASVGAWAVLALLLLAMFAKN